MFAYSWHQTDDETKNWSKSKESLRIYGITEMEKQLVLLLMILNHLFILNYHHQLIGDKNRRAT